MSVFYKMKRYYTGIRITHFLFVFLLCGLVYSYLYANLVFNKDKRSLRCILMEHFHNVSKDNLGEKLQMLKKKNLDLNTTLSATIQSVSSKWKQYLVPLMQSPKLRNTTKFPLKSATRSANATTKLQHVQDERKTENAIQSSKQYDMDALKTKLPTATSLIRIAPKHLDKHAMPILNYNDASSNENKTSRAAILSIDTLMEKIQKNNTKPILTLFTTWSERPDTLLLHNLTVRNWMSLAPAVIPVIFTNDSSVADRCRRLGWNVLPVTKTAAGDIPVLKYMYQDAKKAFNTPFYAFSNGDILYTDGLVKTLVAIINSNIDMHAPVLLIGHRTNVQNVTKEEGSSWEKLRKVANQRGELLYGWGEDFFITSRNYPWQNMADVVIGRIGYDNWLVYYARKLKYIVIDCTKTLLAVHQTTRGNYEGHTHPNRKYNRDLLEKFYKTIKYQAGYVRCAERETQYKNDSIVVEIRKPPNYCSISV